MQKISFMIQSLLWNIPNVSCVQLNLTRKRYKGLTDLELALLKSEWNGPNTLVTGIAKARWQRCDNLSSKVRPIAQQMPLCILSAYEFAQWCRMTMQRGSRTTQNCLKMLKKLLWQTRCSAVAMPSLGFAVHSHESQHSPYDFAGIRNTVAVNLHISFALPSLYWRGSSAVLTKYCRAQWKHLCY